MRLLTKTAARLAMAGLQRIQGRAAALAANPAQMKKIVEVASSRQGVLKGPLDRAQRNLGLMAKLMRDWVEGRYRVVPVKSIAAAAGAVLYFVMPADAVLDLIPLAGFLDDAFVLGLVMRQMREDMRNYAIWKARQEHSTLATG